MQQHYNKYTQEDFEVWKLLFNRQVENLKDKASQLYLGSLEELAPVLNADEVPNFAKLKNALMNKTGWGITVVPGIIPVGEFFEFLSNKHFCSSTWLRSKNQLDYLEEPDMFHDIFGHIPLLMNEDYANFMEAIGKLGVQFIDNEKVLEVLKNLYWFTIEYGLIQEGNSSKMYGAGIISSFGETNHIAQNQVTINTFNRSKILQTGFINSEIQTQYFQLNNFQEMYNSLDGLKEILLNDYAN